MEINTVRVRPGVPPPDYSKNNPLWRVVRAVEDSRLAAGRGFYRPESLQYLFPFRDLELHGPSGMVFDEATVTARDLIAASDFKDDFQKQNIAGFRFCESAVLRGYVQVGDESFPFVRVAYAVSDRSPIRKAGKDTTDHLKLHLRVGNTPSSRLLRVPYCKATGRYELEIWGCPYPDVAPMIDQAGRDALARGELLIDAGLIKGSLSDFQGVLFHQEREAAVRDGQPLNLWSRAPEHAMHPLRPLRIELAWASADETVWDSRDARNHVYEFSMPLRGWRSYLSVGVSPNPHGGVGFLEFRNLFSNYFKHEERRRADLGPDTLTELGRDLPPWSYDADWLDVPVHERKTPDPRSKRRRESFLAVDYMDLHILKPNCCIGIHRHRDNQEVFMLLAGRGLMLMGDWCEFPHRQQAFEVRTMLPGDLSLCKTGYLHALLNPTDEDVSLFMFGGYD